MLAEPHPDQEDLVAHVANRLGLHDLHVFVGEPHRFPGVGEVAAHEDLPHEARARLAEPLGEAERPHEDVEGTNLIGGPVPRRVRRHVRQDDVVRRMLADEPTLHVHLVVGVALDDVRVAPERLLHRLEIDRHQHPRATDATRGIGRPRAGRSSEIEHVLPRLQEPCTPVDLLELENASRREASGFRGACVMIRPAVGVLAPSPLPAHAFFLPPLFFTAPWTRTMLCFEPGTTPSMRMSCFSGMTLAMRWLSTLTMRLPC